MVRFEFEYKLHVIADAVRLVDPVTLTETTFTVAVQLFICMD